MEILITEVTQQQQEKNVIEMIKVCKKIIDGKNKHIYDDEGKGKQKIIMIITSRIQKQQQQILISNLIFFVVVVWIPFKSCENIQ